MGATRCHWRRAMTLAAKLEQLDTQHSRTSGHRFGPFRGQDADLAPDRLPHRDTQSVANVKPLAFRAVAIDDDRAVGQHAVDIEKNQLNGTGLGREF